MRIVLDGDGGSTTWLHLATFITRDEVDRRGAVITSKKHALKYLWANRKRTPRWQEPGIGQIRLAETFRRMLQVILA